MANVVNNNVLICTLSASSPGPDCELWNKAVCLPMTTCHRADCGSNSDAERCTSDDEDAELADLGPLLTSTAEAEKSRVSCEGKYNTIQFGDSSSILFEEMNCILVRRIKLLKGCSQHLWSSWMYLFQINSVFLNILFIKESEKSAVPLE